MRTVQSILAKHTKYYSQWDLVIFTLLTSLSVLNGSTTIFYVIYFFWCFELVRIIIDRIFYKMNKNVVLSEQSPFPLGSSIFPMLIYFVFIVVFFAFIANWKNQDLMQTNMSILFFQNWFFNINIAFVIIERILLHSNQEPVKVNFGLLTPNMIILHISIILGVLLMFFVVHRFPDIFTPDNLWGSVIIISPFLLIRVLAYRLN